MNHLKFHTISLKKRRDYPYFVLNKPKAKIAKQPSLSVKKICINLYFLFIRCIIQLRLSRLRMLKLSCNLILMSVF